MIAKKKKLQTNKKEYENVLFTIVWMYLNSVYMCMFYV